MACWIWVLGGLGLLAAEMVTPGGFFAIFFCFFAILVGVLGALGLSGAPWMEWLLFSVFSILGVLVFRKPLMRRFGMSGGHKTVDRMEKELAVGLEDGAPAGSGKAEIRGTTCTGLT